MAGVYPNIFTALSSILHSQDRLSGLYTGWWPNIAQKIPSYALTWMFFQQLKRKYVTMRKAVPTKLGNLVLGAGAAAGSVVCMIPLDTIKTRLVTQVATVSAAAAEPAATTPAAAAAVAAAAIAGKHVPYKVYLLLFSYYL